MRVVPSQVVSFIEQNFPALKNNPGLLDFPTYSKSAGTLAAIVRLTKEIPSELLTLEADDYSDLVCSSEILISTINRWLQRGGDDPPMS